MWGLLERGRIGDKVCNIDVNRKIEVRVNADFDARSIPP
jgi:hypothetical protein